MSFSAADLAELARSVPPPDSDAGRSASARVDALATPPGALGRLADLAIALAAATGVCPPVAPVRPTLLIAAADHGVHRQGVTMWPQSVTAAIADHVTGVVVYPLMESGQWAATTEVKVNYLAPIKAETIDAEATVVAMTKRSAVVRCELYRQHDRRVLAAAQATLTIVDPR